MTKLAKGTTTEFTIQDAAFEGKGIAKVDGLAVFVPNTAPGDRIKALITKNKKSYREAKLLEVLDPGPHRIAPKCQHAQVCGGCNWQHVDYQHQLTFKREQVQDHMERIGGFSDVAVNETVGCDRPFYYRNKMEYSVGHRRWLSPEEINSDDYIDDHGFAAGLHVPGRYDKVLDINECHLQDSISYQILDFVRNWCKEHDVAPYNPQDQEGFMRNVVIRISEHTDDLMVNLVTFQEETKVIHRLAEALMESFPAISTIVNNINDRSNSTAVGRYEKVIYGDGYIVDRIGNYDFEIDANSFFQTNTRQAERLYEVARHYADIKPDEMVLDLYCGVGTLTLFLSDLAQQVVGVEQSKVAIKNARKNTEKNSAENVHFLQGDIQSIINEGKLEEYPSVDCLITDPPRAGMHADVVEHINEMKVPKLVYISCNSSTMARDLKKLKEVYRIEEIQPVDMFPQTYHIETVAKLRLRED
jgi:23S rRNA (uracil1939-C5)-methyltransferase